mgnify:CR=1 FL=1
MHVSLEACFNHPGNHSAGVLYSMTYLRQRKGMICFSPLRYSGLEGKLIYYFNQAHLWVYSSVYSCNSSVCVVNRVLDSNQIPSDPCFGFCVTELWETR